jgi:hypothetical protein
MDNMATTAKDLRMDFSFLATRNETRTRMCWYGGRTGYRFGYIKRDRDAIALEQYHPDWNREANQGDEIASESRQAFPLRVEMI